MPSCQHAILPIAPGVIRLLYGRASSTSSGPSVLLPLRPRRTRSSWRLLARLSSLSTAPTYTGADALRYAEGSTSSETGEREWLLVIRFTRRSGNSWRRGKLLGRSRPGRIWTLSTNWTPVPWPSRRMPHSASWLGCTVTCPVPGRVVRRNQRLLGRLCGCPGPEPGRHVWRLLAAVTCQGCRQG